MMKNQVAPENSSRKTKNLVENAKKIKPKENVAKYDKFFKPSVSGSRSFFSKSSEPEDKVNNAEPKDFFIKPSAKSECLQKSKKIQSGKQQSNEYSAETKKPFDKRKYRLQKYSKKYKLQQWEDRRKHAILQEYYRQVKDDQPIDVSKIYEDSLNQDSEDDNPDEENHNNRRTSTSQTQSVANRSKNPDKEKTKPFQRAHQEFQRIKEEEIRKKEDILKSKAEKQEAIKKYKKQKVEKYKKLSRRTKKGQPIMKDRMEMLLEKIQSSMK